MTWRCPVCMGETYNETVVVTSIAPPQGVVTIMQSVPINGVVAGYVGGIGGPSISIPPPTVSCRSMRECATCSVMFSDALKFNKDAVERHIAQEVTKALTQGD